MVVLRLVPEAEAEAGPETSGTAAALVGAVAGDAKRLKAFHAGGGGEARHAHPAGVDDGVDAVDGEGRLRNGRGEDDLARPGRRRGKGGILVGARESRVKRMDADGCGQGWAGFVQGLDRAPDFPLPRKEGEHAARPRGKGVAHGAGRGVPEALAGRGRQKPGLHREEPPFGGDGRPVAGTIGVQGREKGLRVQRGREDQQAHLGTHLALDVAAEGQPEVGVKTALVKLVENHHGRVRKHRV